MRRWTPTYELLTLTGAGQERFHAQSKARTLEAFQGRVFVRGVVEVSNFCREDCAYCGMRRSNKALRRHRESVERLAEILLNHRPASVTDVNVQAGEDPVAVRRIVLPLIRLLKKETRLGVSVCLGSLDDSLYAELKAAGAGMYIMKFETGDERLYTKISAPGNLEERTSHIRRLAAQGWFVSSGFICGLPGQSPSSLKQNFSLASRLPLNGCSVSPFIPGETTRFRNHAPASLDLALNCMAALRQMNPDWVIPAVSALNYADPVNGYIRGLNTGANLCTINLTPPAMRDDYLIYRKNRHIMSEDKILSAIEAAGLTPSDESLAEAYWEQPKQEHCLHPACGDSH